MANKVKLLNTAPRRCFFAHAGLTTGFTYLTSGVFLSGLALLMGAGDVLVSYVSVIINICGVVILVLAPLLERFQSRKRLTITLTVLSRLMTLVIAAIPAILPERFQLAAFVSAVVLAFSLQAQTTVALNQWMMGFVDEKTSGRYISLRQTLTLAVTVVLAAVGGWWMDFTQGQYQGFVVLFSVAALLGALEVALLARTPDSAAYRSQAQGCKLHQLVKLPLQNKSFTSFVCYIFAFFLLLNIADSFTMVFLMKYLMLPYQTVTALYMIISLPQIVLLGLWGKLSDRRGHAFVLRTSVWLFAGETLFMFFVSPTTWYIFVPVAFLISSVANAGFVVAVFNRRYELMPQENRIVYDNFYTAVIGIGFILGPMLGGAVKSLLEHIPAVAASMPLATVRLLYLVSTAGILALQLFEAHAAQKGRSNVKN